MLGPFRFDLETSVKPAQDILDQSGGNVLVTAHSVGTIKALTYSKKGTHASVHFKREGRTLLLHEGNLVRA